MIDLNLWPWLERLSLMQKVAPELVPTKANYPTLFAYMNAMLQQPAVKACYFDAETHQKFAQSFIDGKPDYDLGLDL
jgi:glutathione S-transferase